MSPIIHRAKKKAYQLFAIASIAYLVGVTGFTVWVYFTHRKLLFSHLDQSLVRAAYAAEQIISEPVLVRGLTEEDGATSQLIGTLSGQLSRFVLVTDCDAVIAAVGTKNEVDLLAIGTRSDDPVFKESISRESALTEFVSRKVLSQSDCVWHGFSTFKPYGKVRVAMLYRAVDRQSGYALIAIDSTGEIYRKLRLEMATAVAKGLFLIIMVYPMVLFYNRAQQRSTKQLEILNAQLQQDVLQQRAREAKLEDAIHDLERLNAVSVGRENRLIDLKREVNALLRELNRPDRYRTSFEDGDKNYTMPG